MRDTEVKEEKKQTARLKEKDRKKEAGEIKRRKEEERKMKEYVGVMDDADKMTSNQGNIDLEEDFM